mmetsp:Transcript_122722/g.342350  ORF Transcript_122722/g.342350 Transcript_122722/m.342350 type:complete len:338 (-) Transcript_122722:148-1161(-)
MPVGPWREGAVVPPAVLQDEPMLGEQLQARAALRLHPPRPPGREGGAALGAAGGGPAALGGGDAGGLPATVLGTAEVPHGRRDLCSAGNGAEGPALAPRPRDVRHVALSRKPKVSPGSWKWPRAREGPWRLRGRRRGPLGRRRRRLLRRQRPGARDAVRPVGDARAAGDELLPRAAGRRRGPGVGRLQLRRLDVGSAHRQGAAARALVRRRDDLQTAAARHGPGRLGAPGGLCGHQRLPGARPRPGRRPAVPRLGAPCGEAGGGRDARLVGPRRGGGAAADPGQRVASTGGLPHALVVWVAAGRGRRGRRCFGVAGAARHGAGGLGAWGRLTPRGEP